MVAERVVHGFWPLWTILFAVLAPLMFGWHDGFPLEATWAYAVVAVLSLAIAVYVGLRRFKWPSEAEALSRVDASLAGRPISAILDSQAVGAGDPDSEAVWAAHMARMAQRTQGARATEPDLRVSARDPFGLRYAALLFFVTALLFGSVWRIGEVAVAGTGTQTIASGPSWEGWIAPPDYTGRPSIYLADLSSSMVQVPDGSRITIRLYGDVGDLTVDETVSGRTGTDIGAASDLEHAFVATQSGTLRINGAGGREWRIELEPDLPPAVELTAPVDADAKGQMSQPFRAMDDYGVISGQAEIALDLEAVDRRYGLAVEPDPIDSIVVDLPMPFNGQRDEFDEALIGDFSEHPLANLPVTVTLSVTDAIDQTGSSNQEPLVLPGKRFFQPLAKAIVEQRRDIIWSSSNAKRGAQLLRAVSHRPEGFISDDTKFLRLRFIVQRLEGMIGDGEFDDDERLDITQALWDLAIQFEEGSLADARARLERAQERLAEAMRNGASADEIQELMDELRDATRDYMQMLADQMDPNEDGTDQPDQNQETTEFSQDELDALMDRIQELMEEGRMAEAQALMEQLNQLLENMQIAQGEGQDGPTTRGQQAMRDLGETLQDQQDLSDEAFRDLQDQFNNAPQDQQDQGQQEQGQQPSSEGEPDAESLADRQQALRDLLGEQRQNLPNLQGDAGQAAEDALEQAERSMDRAEDALREGDLPEAINRQADAMDAMREGLRDMGRALAEAQNPQDEQGQDGVQQGQVQQPNRRDPLGRETGTQGQLGSEDEVLGMTVQRRAEELLDELRRRSSEQERPKVELDYLKRLLDRF